MQAVLVMFRSDGERRSFSVTRDMTVIGRREDCDLRIPLGEVSRKHCRIVRDGDILKVEDLGSSNGTFLNAQRVQEALLSPGDSIQVGPVVFVLQIDGEPADDELSPVQTQPVEAAGAAAAAGAAGANGDSGPLQPTIASEVGEEDELDVLEEIHEEDEAIAAASHHAERTEDEEELEALEPLEELDPLEPDLAAEDDSVESERKA